MKIMSLNVNRFLALRVASGSWVKDIVELAKKILNEDNNLVFLYEVPYFKGFCGKFYGTYELFNDLLNEFQSYNIFFSEARKAYSCTMAIANPAGNWGPVDVENRFEVVLEGEKIKQNKFIELKYENDGEELRVLGVHASISENEREKDIFLPALSDYVKKISLSSGTGAKFMILGDLNCHMGKESSHKEYLVKMKDYLYDLVADGTATFFPAKKGRTDDHVLISEGLKGKAIAYVIPQIILELSDHAVIIVDVDL